MTARTVADPGSNKLPIEIWATPAAFATFVVIGCLYIVYAKEHGVRQVLVTFVPVMIMLGYASLIFMARLVRVRDDQAGDNLYYMGFLFTLTSLGASLYQFNASGDAEYIVQNFGIAIASTIAGVLFRVMYNQMRRDPVEVERVARLELADAARRVRSELDNTVLEFNHFRRATLQSMQEGFDEIRAHVDDVSRKLLAGLEEVTQKSVAPLEEASRKSAAAIGEGARRSAEAIGEGATVMVAALGDSAKQLTGGTERLSEGAASIAQTLDEVSGRLAAMQAPDEVIRIKLDPTIKGIASAVDRFSKRLDEHGEGTESAIEGIRVAADAVNAAAGQGKEASAASEAAMRSAVDTCLKAVQELSTTISSFGTEAGAQTGRVETVLRRVDETIAALKEAASSASQKQAGQVENLSRIMSEATSRQAGQVESLSRIVSEAASRQTGHMESLSKLIPAIEQSASSIHVAVEKITPLPPPANPKRSFWMPGSN